MAEQGGIKRIKDIRPGSNFTASRPIIAKTMFCDHMIGDRAGPIHVGMRVTPASTQPEVTDTKATWRVLTGHVHAKVDMAGTCLETVRTKAKARSQDPRFLLMTNKECMR